MSSKVEVPFAWLSRWLNWLAAGGLLLIAAVLRFYELNSLPPGLYTEEANTGLQALQFIQHGTWPGFTGANEYSPLWILLQSISVQIFGHTIIALRLWPALLGVAAVVGTWLWARTWFDRRIAWLAAFTVAVTPWAITLSRNALATALIMALVPFTFWAATMAIRRNSLTWWSAAATLLVLDLFAGPLGWLLIATVGILGVIRITSQHSLLQPTRPKLASLGIFVLGLAVFAYGIGTSLSGLKSLGATAGLPPTLSSLADTMLRLVLMFNLRGDENIRHNFAGQPMLNAFFGLMFVAGLLVAISQLHRRLYQITILTLLLLLSPAILSSTGAPNAARAVAALPLIAIVVGLGISYMLTLWYRTFPINSAARSTGLAVIAVLLILSLLQGYTQYFRAWAASNETYLAYNEAAVAASHTLAKEKFSGNRYLIAQPDELPVAAYLTTGNTSYQALPPSRFAALPVNPGTYQFIITAGARDEAAKNLRLKFPGGKLRPRVSSFSQNEIFYIYEVTR